MRTPAVTITITITIKITIKITIATAAANDRTGVEIAAVESAVSLETVQIAG